MLREATPTHVPADALAVIDRVERLVSAHLAPDGHAADALSEAARRARALGAAISRPESSQETACQEEVSLSLDWLLSPVLGEVYLELGNVEVVRSLLDEVADAAGQSPAYLRVRLAPAALGAPALLGLRPELAVQAVLGMVAVLAPVRQASLWEADGRAEEKVTAHVGGRPSAGARKLAQSVLAGEPASRLQSGGLWVLPVGSAAGRARGALVGRAEAAGQARSAPVLKHAAAALAAVLERRALLDACGSTESSLSSAYERRLLRLALDLHDGPLQNAAGISGDLGMLRRRLERPESGTDRHRLLGTISDLEARLEAIDRELRDLAHSLESPAIARRPLTEVLRREADSFRRRCPVRLGLELRGDLNALTASQRIALVRVIQEALSNIREHAGAHAVRVVVSGGRDGIGAVIEDDGCGFDVESTLLDAARRGRMGLVGVSERVRLLGGSCRIRSRPGGPTTISIELPRWDPRAAGESADPDAGLVPT